MSAQFGSFVKFDEKTELRQNPEIARVYVSTSSLSSINKIMSVKIDGKVFKIKVVEEIICECNSATVEESDDESESQGGYEDDNVSVKNPAPATKKGSGSGGAALQGGSKRFVASVVSDARRLSHESGNVDGPTSIAAKQGILKDTVNDVVVIPRNNQSDSSGDVESNNYSSNLKIDCESGLLKDLGEAQNQEINGPNKLILSLEMVQETAQVEGGSHLAEKEERRNQGSKSISTEWAGEREKIPSDNPANIEPISIKENPKPITGQLSRSEENSRNTQIVISMSDSEVGVERFSPQKLNSA